MKYLKLFEGWSDEYLYDVTDDLNFTIEEDWRKVKGSYRGKFDAVKLSNSFADSFTIKENNFNIKVPKYLYHATFKPLLKKIKSEGLGGTSAKQLWNDSKTGVVYLALDANVAYSYAETVFDENDDIPESWEDKIIVLVIDTENLDKTKFYLDSNVLDNEGDTIEYHDIIPFDCVVNIITEDDL